MRFLISNISAYTQSPWNRSKIFDNFHVFSNKYKETNKGVLLSSTLYNDMTHTLMPYWLCSGDRGYMGIPVEVRAPFLDYRILEYAYQLPISFLIRDGWHKWILRIAMDNILPKKVNWRKKKLGFPFPIKRFIAESNIILDYIFTHSSNPYIDFNKKKQLYTDWKTISFILWYELFFNENLELFNKIKTMSNNTETP